MRKDEYPNPSRVSVSPVLYAVLALAVLAIVAVVLPAPSVQAGSDNAESLCGLSGPPVGIDPVSDPETLPGNPGELASWIARNVGHSDEVNPGNAKNDDLPIFKQVCNPHEPFPD